MMRDYLARYDDEHGPRHTVVRALNDHVAVRLAKQRLSTIAWKGCRLTWIRPIEVEQAGTLLGSRLDTD